jgi:hypothetical protein
MFRSTRKPSTLSHCAITSRSSLRELEAGSPAKLEGNGESCRTMIAGKRDQLLGKIQERFGVARDEAERQVKEYESTYEQV